VHLLVLETFQGLVPPCWLLVITAAAPCTSRLVLLLLLLLVPLLLLPLLLLLLLDVLRLQAAVAAWPVMVVLPCTGQGCGTTAI
jgi:hypothetical protein